MPFGLINAPSTFQSLLNDIFRAKCSFGTTNVEYLGHIVSQNGVATDPSKVLVSKSIKALRDVLGLTDAFRWCLEAKKIFQNLKEVMMTTLVLALPNKQFVIEPDASEVRIGAVLMNYMIPFKKMFQSLLLNNLEDKVVLKGGGMIRSFNGSFQINPLTLFPF
ncbi:uncharacterized protein LOC121987382 [Zingiber officinale]|uniref:uncharacterized protein LOC121987382 n=1 Tax=Zingiber officinale TaxID=94328 RepID=UPI001C4AA9F8|nr:uncharacterized protein LOC121987382 [Zingiber officinale]